MTALIEELDRLLAAEAEAGLLAGPNGIDSADAALDAAKLAQPLVVSALADWAIDAGSNLIAYLRSAGTDDDQIASEDEPARRLFGKRLVPATNAVRVESDIAEGSAISILDWMGAVATKALSQQVVEDDLDAHSLASVLRNERQALHDSGWGPWIEMVGRGEHLAEANTVSTPVNTTSNLAVAASAAAAGHDERSEQGEASDAGATPAVGEPDDQTSGDASGDGSRSEAEEDQAAKPEAEKPGKTGTATKKTGTEAKTDKKQPDVPTTGTGPYRGDRWDALGGDDATARDLVGTTAPDADGDKRSGSRAPLLIGAVGVAALMGGGLFALLSSGGDGEPTDQAAVEADADEDTGSSPDETGDDGDITPVTTAQADEETDPADDAMDDSSTSTDAAADTGIVTIQVPMRDIKGVSPEAAGTADFEFNTETGEICYTFEAEGVQGPFATHIHVGANGIRGGIVVDFGPNESPAAGCVDNPPDDTADILAFPASHYAELHDAGGEFTVRGQLSDQAPSDEEQPELAFTDPDGGGAQAVVEAGRIVLQGPIADRMTADRLAAEYAALGLAGVDVIDNLTVAADAPPPSGRVVLNDAILFAVGSAELGATDQGVLDVLVAVATSDPNSTMTIVGHTDSTGDPVANLELSLERANALRDVLVGAGIPLERLRVEGAGDTDPLGDNATAEGRALNRRIEVELKPAVG